MGAYDRLRALLPRMLRFGAVGVLNTVVDLGVLNALLYAFADDASHAALFPLFATVSFACATLNSFFLNRRWTFRAAGEGSAARDLPRFYAVTLVSFAVNVGLSSFLVWVQPFPTLSPTLWANAAKLLAVGLSLTLNFVGYQKLVFRSAA